jgi:CheY-like chemotaxis protein
MARPRQINVPKILVADDNTNIQKMVALAFRERGIDVTSVGNGEAAVRRIPDLKPDLILADIFMPVRNGYEVCEFVKKNDDFSHIPVILMVGAFDPLDEKEARRVGADGILKKPFVPPDPLIAMVTSALERNPKLAAELARAKETVVEPPAAVEIELPAKIEPKPLPEFPEPSPDEAALVYGFGNGKRDLEDEIEKAASKEPVAPAFEANAEDDESGEEQASGGWRRAAMDFEVPEEDAKGPAYSTDMDLESDAASFPSERDVPPKRVVVPDLAEEEEPVALGRAPESAPLEPFSASFAEAEVSAFESALPADAETLDTPAASSVPHPAELEDAVAAEPNPGDSWLATISPGEESSQDAAPEPAEHVSSGYDSESVASSEDEPASRKDPDIEEPPAAYATPEQPETSDSWFAAPSPVEEPSHDAAPEPGPAVHVSSGFDSEFVAPPEDEPASRKDPDLEEPPAVRAAPEPLLVDDEPQASPEYGTRVQEIQPLYSFLPPVMEDSHEEPAEQEASPHEETGISLGTWHGESSERIPTVPPPEPAALSDIPFLAPPAVSRSSAEEAGAAEQETVDALVRKLLERIGPQLHEMISQGVLQPLVEDLVQKELAKKEK